MKKELHTAKEVAVKAVKGFGFVAVLSVGLVGCSSEEPVKKEETKQSQEVKKEVKESEEVDKQQEEAKQQQEAEAKKAEAEKAKQQEAEAKKAEAEKAKQQQEAEAKAKKAETEKAKQQQEAQKQQKEDVKTSAIALDDALNIHKSKVAVIVGYIEDEFTRADLKDSAWRQGMHANLASLKRLVVDMPNGGVAEGKQNDYNRYYNIMEKLYYCSQTLSENISNGNQELFERAKTNFIDVAENQFKPLGK
ncbi:hypothetical protein COI92_24160 [Bacillus anthracis]|uniref:hypothetical protein n=1 Tax=Bacillus sp. AFS051223 TaxID=2034280 RepID=UPI000BF8E058|nr:hypothetical protein [Bacillus sp. AFS051223]PFJ24602.1 hypothetical protein COI92_24160 [Bacillus anthracis]PFM22278.1 hypothetical protein COJ44_01640 [Bacillus anthracis]PHA06716.1 hypothetical protein COE65_25170 [Bacillus sp. AFS051223]